MNSFEDEKKCKKKKGCICTKSVRVSAKMTNLQIEDVNENRKFVGYARHLHV